MAERGGLRCQWLAQLTRGRLGVGRWTRIELKELNRRAQVAREELAPRIDWRTGG